MGLRRRWRGLVIAGLGLAGCGGVTVDDQGDAGTGAEVDASADAAAADAAAADAAVPGSVVLSYDFESPLLDEGDDVLVLDRSGNDHHGVVKAPLTNTGAVELVTRADGPGSALRFPAPCDAGKECPRVRLEARDSVELNPGQRDFAVSFDILAPEGDDDMLTVEQNVIQKGEFDDLAQWKLELSPARLVSCVFHFPMEGEMPVTLTIPAALAVDEWYEVRCERRGSTLSLRVSQGVGAEVRTFEIPDGVVVDISNAKPILVGGQNGSPSADQFYGSLDNVRIEIFEPR
jgi:hypothetical protein